MSIKLCAGCRIVPYCSEACQRHARPYHKLVCVHFERQRMKYTKQKRKVTNLKFDVHALEDFTEGLRKKNATQKERVVKQGAAIEALKDTVEALQTHVATLEEIGQDRLSAITTLEAALLKREEAARLQEGALARAADMLARQSAKSTRLQTLLADKQAKCVALLRRSDSQLQVARRRAECLAEEVKRLKAKENAELDAKMWTVAAQSKDGVKSNVNVESM